MLDWNMQPPAKSMRTLIVALLTYLFTKCERKNNLETLLFHSGRRSVETPWRCCFGAIPSPPLRYYTSKASHHNGSINSPKPYRRYSEDSRFFFLRLKILARILVKANRYIKNHNQKPYGLRLGGTT